MDDARSLRDAMTMNGFFSDPLAKTDPEVAAAIADELVRQQDQIEMIASENIVSVAVMEAQGSVLTNKYAEGYAGRRYYGGCEHVDVVETLAIERAKKLFGLQLCECAAAFWCTGQSGSVFELATTGRHNLGHVTCCGWTFNTWCCAKLVRQMV